MAKKKRNRYVAPSTIEVEDSSTPFDLYSDEEIGTLTADEVRTEIEDVTNAYNSGDTINIGSSDDLKTYVRKLIVQIQSTGVEMTPEERNIIEGNYFNGEIAENEFGTETNVEGNSVVDVTSDNEMHAPRPERQESKVEIENEHKELDVAPTNTDDDVTEGTSIPAVGSDEVPGVFSEEELERLRSGRPLTPTSSTSDASTTPEDTSVPGVFDDEMSTPTVIGDVSTASPDLISTVPDVNSESETTTASSEDTSESNDETSLNGEAETDDRVSHPIEGHSDIDDLERDVAPNNTRTPSDNAVQNDGLVPPSAVNEEIQSTGDSQVEPQPVMEGSDDNLSETESHSSTEVTDPVSVNIETASGSMVDGEAGTEVSPPTSEPVIDQPANINTDEVTEVHNSETASDSGIVDTATDGNVEEVPPTLDPANDTLTVPSVESEEPPAVSVLNPSDTDSNKDPNEFAVEDNFSPFVKSTLAQLKDYTETMAIGQMVSRETINLQQRRLNRLLTQVIMAVQHKDFEDLMYETVNIFIEHRDRCFHPSYVYRGIDEISALEMDTKERMRFYGMIDAFRGLADPQQHGRLAHNYLFSEIRETVPEQYAARFILFCKRYAE